jgi:hypothetical protein
MSNLPAGHPDQTEGETYDICLRGHLDTRWAARLSVSTLTHNADGTTTLRAAELDQAALHGLLQRVRDLGLTLVSIVRVDDASDDASIPTQTLKGTLK